MGGWGGAGVGEFSSPMNPKKMIKKILGGGGARISDFFYKESKSEFFFFWGGRGRRWLGVGSVVMSVTSSINDHFIV